MKFSRSRLATGSFTIAMLVATLIAGPSTADAQRPTRPAVKVANGIIIEENLIPQIGPIIEEVLIPQVDIRIEDLRS